MRRRPFGSAGETPCGASDRVVPGR
ncbi:hypothetical protein SEA_ALVY_84 [Streptomyces phage Alvy]|uniref:Uncharacterized protein n=1 Tax=Streptomyces phage Alvy TaxID=2599888 RepID=A0A5J6TNP2_9CAUD|nr:hypothetical protein KGG89_gp10 [Streptomyces phage Alvy]QFG12503.1 hypothetical protein SEA_ALVY_84 [Streptomyces phage Alvy]